MRHIERAIAGLMLLAAVVAAGEARKAPSQSQAKANAPAAQAASDDRGQQVFNQNCSRCHNAPDGFSPSISGAIARHMRVRASLSQDDYKALLKFFNP